MEEEIDAVDFWDGRFLDERRIILTEIVKRYDGEEDVLGIDIEKPFAELKRRMQALIRKYYSEVIAPQLEGQQIRYDGIIEEKLPDEYTCPRCSAPMVQIQDKRGIHWKCKNCNWDTERPWDLSAESREFHIARCAQLLKDMFPEMNFVRNFPYSPDAILTGVFKSGIVNYDIGVYFMGLKLQRLRIERNQHLTQERFMGTDHDIYVIGRKAIVEKLADRGGVVVHYLVDEPEQKKQVGMSRLKKVRDNCPQKTDRFGNIQYAIPKNLRPLIVSFDRKEMRRMLTADYYEIHTGKMVIK